MSSTNTSMPGSRASSTGLSTLRIFDRSSVASLGGSFDGIGHEIDGAAGALGQRRARAHDHGRHGGTHRAQTGEAHSQGFGHGMIREHGALSVQPRLASGTTLCSFSGPVSRKRRMLRAAWRMRCSFSTSAMRT